MTDRPSAALLSLLRHIADRPDLTALYSRAMERLSLGAADYAAALELGRLTGLSSLGTHTLLLCLFIALDEGQACLPLTDAAIVGRLTRFLEGDPAAELAAVRQALASGELTALLADGGVEFKPLCRQVGHGGESYLSFQRQAAQAARLAGGLQSRLDLPGGLPSDDIALAAAIAVALRTRPVMRDGVPMQLDHRQQWAVAVGLTQRLAFVSGGPGTGKTAILTALVRCYLELGLPPARIALTAPTGRAARRMTESLRRDLASLAVTTPAEIAARQLAAGTLHRLLDFDRGANRFRRHRFHPLPADVVLVDEVSMVDVRLMAALLEATPPAARLVLIGDPDQLPPVEAGEVLADLLRSAPAAAFSAPFRARLERLLGSPPAAVAPSAAAAEPPQGPPQLLDRVVKLERNYRSLPALQRLAQAVQAGSPQEFVRLPAGPPEDLFAAGATGGFWLPADQPDQPAWPAIVDQWLKRQYLTAGPEGAPTYFQAVERLQRQAPEGWLAPALWPDWESLFARLEAARILTAVRQGPLGCDTLNRFIQHRLQQLRGRRRHETEFAGLPILVLENDEEVELFNGDLGLLMVDRDGIRQALFRGDDGFRLLPATALPAYAPAFAMTVHKSQGSEYDQVLAVLPDDPAHRLLRRDLLYTAVTRARQAVLLYATQPALAAALAHQVERWRPDGWLFETHENTP